MEWESQRCVLCGCPSCPRPPRSPLEGCTSNCLLVILGFLNQPLVHTCTFPSASAAVLRLPCPYHQGGVGGPRDPDGKPGS